MGQLFSSFYHNHLIDIKLNQQIEPPKPQPQKEPEPEPEVELEVESESESEVEIEPEPEGESQIELSNVSNDFVPSPLIEPVSESDQIVGLSKDVLFTQFYKNKKALLIGINYSEDDNKDNDLYGCENDMNRLSQWIQNNFHFESYSITKLDSSSAIKEEIMTELLLMVEFAKNNRNSELFFSYSGHGTHYFSYNEKDYQNEAICPVDYMTNGLISDDWLKKNFIEQLPEDCKLFAIMDCCHSGSNMDLPYYMEDNLIKFRPDMSIPTAKVIKLSGCLDSQVSMDYYNRRMKEFQGAFTNAFIMSFTNENMITNVDNLNVYLQTYNFKQVSELSLSHMNLKNWKLC